MAKRKRSRAKTPKQSKSKATQPVADEKKISADVTPDQDDVLYKLLDAKIEIPIEVLRNKHIFIATPCYGGQIGEPYFRSMMRLAILCNKYDIQFTVSTLANESLITRGRNTLVSFFMEHPDATHLFFIDADIEFDPNDLLRMVAYDRPITVGAYPKKAINWQSIIEAARRNDEETTETIEGHSSNYVVNFEFVTDEDGNPQNQIQIRDNLIKLKDAGTGFMCIQRDVIQKMFDAHPELKYANDINVDEKFEKHMYASVSYTHLRAHETGRNLVCRLLL